MSTTDAINLLCDVLDSMLPATPAMHAPIEAEAWIAAARALVADGGAGVPMLAGYYQGEFYTSPGQITNTPRPVNGPTIPFAWEGWQSLPCTIDLTVTLHNASGADWSWATLMFWVTQDGVQQGSQRFIQVQRLPAGQSLTLALRNVFYLGGQGDGAYHAFAMWVQLQSPPAGCSAENFEQSAGYLLYPYFTSTTVRAAAPLAPPAPVLVRPPRRNPYGRAAVYRIPQLG